MTQKEGALIPTIGLEIHAELKTKSKMFCSSKNDPDETRPNINVCPICIGHPGTLPTINRQAVLHMIKIGLSVNGEIADFTEFDRKHYFYPDIPKGYQISQYKYPIVSGGILNNISLTRIHLEEDTGLSKHDRGDFSLIDYNRSGVPLMELVTEPVIRSAKDAVDFAKELQRLLRILGVADANMEKGEMRVEANISVSNDPNKMGTKVEVKNLNSFKSVEKAIEYEIKRMSKLIESGKADEIVQETRGWDENNQKTFSQRKKETSDDYRYFPEPDLPKMFLKKEFSIDEIKKELPELPWQLRERLKNEFDLKDNTIEIFIDNPIFLDLFEKVVEECNKKTSCVKLAENYISTDLKSLEKDYPDEVKNLKYPYFSRLILMIDQGQLTSRAAKDILLKMLQNGQDPQKIAESEGLLQVDDDGLLDELTTKIINENEQVVTDFKDGKEAALQYLIGQVMRLSKGALNPQKIAEKIKEKIS